MKVRQVLSVTAIVSLFLLSTEVQAKPSQAMVSITPITSPKITIQKGDRKAFISYNVCNNSKRTFRGIKPQFIKGGSFNLGAFDLKPRQCRMLKVMIDPDLMSPEGIHGGPVLQLAQGNKEALEANFWNIQPAKDDSMSVSSSSSSNYFEYYMYGAPTPSEERDPNNESQSRYPGYTLVTNTSYSSMTIYEEEVAPSAHFAVRDNESTCKGRALVYYETCLLVIDWTKPTEEDSTGTISVSGAGEDGDIGSGETPSFGLSKPIIITSTPADLSALNLVKGTPLVITITGAHAAPALFPGWALLVEVTTDCTGSPDYICTLTVETDLDSVISIPLTDFYIQDIAGAEPSIALKGKMSINQV